MNIPNKLTIFRVLLIPVYMILYLTQGVAVKYAAIGVFILAALTDQIDGYLARKNNQITTFGKLMDPLADKMLIMAALICFVQKDVKHVNAAVVMIILARELIVTGIRMIAMGDNKVIAASIWGKSKTVSQFVLTIGVMVFDIARTYIPQYGGIMDTATLVFVIVAVILTIFSGIDYCCKNWHLLKFK